MSEFEKAMEPSDVQRGVPPMPRAAIPETKSTVWEGKPAHVPLTKQLAQALDDMASVEKRIRQIMDQITRVKNDVL